jgi:hypothetical protein
MGRTANGARTGTLDSSTTAGLGSRTFHPARSKWKVDGVAGPPVARDSVKTNERQPFGHRLSESNMAKYRELEQLVARIQQQLAPRSKVIHNAKLLGRLTGRMRQIDVLLEHTVGQFKIEIVIDCKDYKKPLDVKGVEEFYGLLDDVGAQKGVLVCPKGFTKVAKIRAEKLQIDLYSPVDTDPHKWQVRVTIPALCDFRRAAISFGVMFSSPVPMRVLPDFFNNDVFSKRSRLKLGTITGCAVDRWNSGGFPTDVGTHENLPIFDEEITTDNGYGMQVPMHLYVGLNVTRELYFGQQPITKFSGFKDEIRGNVIANAFQFGLLDPEEVEASWKKIASEAEAPIRPVIFMIGLVGWAAPRSEQIIRGF